ncbi:MULTISPECIES: YtzI protein [Bacillaceae]|uniref:YtzI protein n=1 Tax=Sutcliffiella horikoshii TaxID=79883 RepID=A0A5D4T869_9BACI|nr:MULTISPECIES: YtzI protein [Bacillaceae]TYS71445.1 YtzI protein [Sutcliffiella horikoshii]
MKIILIICIIIVLVVLFLTLLSTNKAYKYEHTIDPIEPTKNDTDPAEEEKNKKI